MLVFATATKIQRVQFLGMLLDQMGPDSQAGFEHLGISRQDFEELYAAKGEVRVLLQREQLAGFIWIELRDHVLHIHGIILLPEMRGCGIGQSAIELLEREFHARIAFIELGVQTKNVRAHRFYRRVGFEPVNRHLPPGFAVLRKPIEKTRL